MSRVYIELEIDRIVLDGVTINDPEVFKDTVATKLAQELTQGESNFSEDRDLQRINGPSLKYRPSPSLDGSEVAGAVYQALIK